MHAAIRAARRRLREGVRRRFTLISEPRARSEGSNAGWESRENGFEKGFTNQRKQRTPGTHGFNMPGPQRVLEGVCNNKLNVLVVKRQALTEFLLVNRSVYSRAMPQGRFGALHVDSCSADVGVYRG